MPTPKSPKHVVVDGSNIATEGRSAPSLKQLHEAVLVFMNENPDAKITVVVDASFGHRIDKKELAEFDEAVNNNELVTPPAGAIGRGDAFVLAIADRVGATVISNDSYQEFHAEYPWLFTQGRLIGGKPVPHIGWVFVERTPVRGPVSKKAMRAHDAAKRGAVALPKKASKEASAPMPVPKAPPPGGRLATKSPEKAQDKRQDRVQPKTVAAKAPAGRQEESRSVNDVLVFLSFVEKHPVGSKVKGIVDSYSAHGAYIALGEVKAYAPLRLLGNPPPRSARDSVKIGDSISLVVAGYTPSRRSVEVGVPEAVKIEKAPVATKKAAKPRVEPAPKTATPKTATTKTVAAKKAAPAKKTAAPAKKVAPAKVAAAKKVTSAKAATAKTAAAKTTATKKPVEKKPAAKKPAEKKVSEKKVSEKKAK
jgi:Zc3h12a-like Ribonuclease NYN domain